MSLADSAEALRLLLMDFNGSTGCRMSAVVTRSGGIVAAVLPDDVHADNFATMAATLLGALEVICTTANAPSPESVNMHTDVGNLLLRVLNPRTFFVAVTEEAAADAARQVEETALRARTLLAPRA